MPDGTGYIVEKNQCIRKLSNGQISTWAGQCGFGGNVNGIGTNAKFGYVYEIAVNASGYVFFPDQSYNVVRLISPDRQVSTFAGSGISGILDGPVLSAKFNYIRHITLNETNGDIYISEWNQACIRRISQGNVSTFAGTCGTSGYLDGPNTIAQFSTPTQMAIDYASGNLIVADNANQKLRKVSNVMVSTLSTSIAVTIQALAINPRGEIYTGSQQTIYKVNQYTGESSLIAGSRFSTGSLGGDPSQSLISGVRVLSLDLNDNIYYSDYSCIRKIDYCPVNSYRNPVTKACIFNTCYAGYQLNRTSNTCDTCSSGTFKPYNDDVACSSCTYGCFVTFNRTACVCCASDEYFSSTANSCVICPSKGICNATMLIGCQSGYGFNTKPNLCIDCPVGFETMCNGTACVSCQANQFRSSLSMPACAACPSNAVCSSSVNFTCNAAFTLSGSSLSCEPCQEGYSKVSAGNSVCTQCLIGTESAADMQSCTVCTSGKYRPSTIFNKCIPCPPNGICTTSDLTKCSNGYKKNSAGDGCELL